MVRRMGGGMAHLFKIILRICFKMGEAENLANTGVLVSFADEGDARVLRAQVCMVIADSVAHKE